MSTFNTENDFYITVFSDQSINKYKNSTKNKFTVDLPTALEFPSDNYEVGLVDAFFSPVMGLNDNPGEPIDEIQFPNASGNEKNSIIINNLCDLIVMYAKEGSIYTKNYFKPWLDVRNYKDFGADTSIFNIFKAPIPEPTSNSRLYLEIPTLNDMDFENDKSTNEYVFLESNTKYTLHNIIYLILMKWNTILQDTSTKYKTLKGNHNFDAPGQTISETLFSIFEDFFIRFNQLYFYTYLEKIPTTDLVLIYCDIVQESIVSNHLSKILHIANVPENHTIEHIEILNPQYRKISKQHITSISFFIANEKGQSIVFESYDNKPTVLVLHFRKKSIN